MSAGLRLVLRGVRHAYRDLLVLEDIDLVAEPGEVMVLVGPSGCGKSTLLGIMGGMLAPLAGEVRAEGDVADDCLNPFTYVFQDFALLPWRTVAGNVVTGAGEPPVARRRRRASRRRAGAHRPGRVCRSVAAPVIRRHAPARRHRSRAGGAAGMPADGRTAVGARCADARSVAGRIRRADRSRRHHHDLCHAQPCARLCGLASRSWCCRGGLAGCARSSVSTGRWPDASKAIRTCRRSKPTFGG